MTGFPASGKAFSVTAPIEDNSSNNYHSLKNSTKYFNDVEPPASLKPRVHVGYTCRDENTLNPLRLLRYSKDNTYLHLVDFVLRVVDISRRPRRRQSHHQLGDGQTDQTESQENGVGDLLRGGLERTPLPRRRQNADDPGGHGETTGPYAAPELQQQNENVRCGEFHSLVPNRERNCLTLILWILGKSGDFNWSNYFDCSKMCWPGWRSGPQLVKEARGGFVPKWGAQKIFSFEIYLHIMCARGVLGAIISRSNVTYHASCKRVRIKLVVILIISRIVNCHKHWRSMSDESCRAKSVQDSLDQ